MKIELEELIISNAKEQIDRLLSVGKNDIAEKLINACYEKNHTIANRIKLVGDVIRGMHVFEINLTVDSLLAEMKGVDILEYFTYVILYPEVTTTDYMLDDKWEEFPLKWLLSEMTIAEGRMLFISFKENNNLDFVFENRYDESKLGEILSLLDGHVIPEFDVRASILKEAITCYNKTCYAATISLLIPLIEGLIWDFSEIYDRKYKNVYSKMEDKLLLITKDGKHLSDYTIGSLLNNSAFGEIIDQDLLQYFCNELYKERNPIFHGRNLSFATKLNAEKKLCAFEYIIESINRAFWEDMFETMEKFFPDEVVEKVLEGDMEVLKEFIKKVNADFPSAE